MLPKCLQRPIKFLEHILIMILIGRRIHDQKLTVVNRICPIFRNVNKIIITCLEVIHLSNHLLLFLLSPCFRILISTIDFQISINQRGWERCQIQVFGSFIR